MEDQDLNRAFEQMAATEQTRKDAQSRVDALKPHELVTTVFGTEPAPMLVRQAISQSDPVLPVPRRQACELVMAQTGRDASLDHRLAVSRLLEMIHGAR